MGRIRQFTQSPFDPKISSETKQFLDWVATSVNALQQQNLSGSGFSSLATPTVNPTTSQITSLGSRVSSITTRCAFACPSTTSIVIYWDGTNSSQQLKIYRDDNSISGPYSGNQAITGLTANTQYFFYPYFDETTQTVHFVSQPGASTNPVGSPPIAYTATDILIAQQQILRGRVPLWANLTVTGITTPNAGTTPATKFGGGGGGPGAYLGKSL